NTMTEHTNHDKRTEGHHCIDTHLLELWRKRRRVVKISKKDKSRTTLQGKIARLTYEAREYADQLATDIWLQTCENMSDNLHTPRLWQIVRTPLGQSRP
ncbi:hypothetical protein HPB47_014752, partial [Ixodes persulcatus]